MAPPFFRPALTALAAAALLPLSLPMARAAAPERPAAPSERICPSGLPEATRCLSGRDHLGAWYWIAVPKDWSGVLVVHAHGGPSLGEPTLARVTGDLQRWKVMLQAGHA